MSIEDLLKIYKNSSHEAFNLFQACNKIKNLKDHKIFLGLTSELINNESYKMVKELIRNGKVHVLVTTPEFVIFDILKGNKENCDKDILKENKNEENKENLKTFFEKICLEMEKENFKKENLNIFKNDSDSNEEENIFCISEFLKIIGNKLGKNSLLGQAQEKKISIYIPTFCDSILGFILSDIFKNKKINLILDPIKDVKNLNRECFGVKKSAAIILAGSNIKHSILNANLFKDGVDFCLIVNFNNESDCSDSGADVDEAISWGKARNGIKLRCDPGIVFPILYYYWNGPE